MNPAANTLAPRPWLLSPAWIAFAVVALLIALLDVQSQLRDAREIGLHLGWGPVAWEYSSAATLIALYPIIWWAARAAAPGDGRWARFALIHALASLVFSVGHVAGFVVIRHGLYALAGERYHFGGLGAFFYEYQRDLIAYGMPLGLIWGTVWLLNARAEPQMERPAGEPAATFDIRDGARTLRVPISEIAAVSSAGNYVEFNLIDCRKPLMRATLGAIERDFAARGFVRIHRSWLVNAARVEAIEPAGSGDFTVTLAGGLKAPLSRRFRAALEALRG